MQQIGKLHVDNMKIKNNVKTYDEYPNVISMHPTMTDIDDVPFNDNDAWNGCLFPFCCNPFKLSDALNFIR